MKLNAPAERSPSSLPPDLKKLYEYTRQRLQGGLTLKDNIKCALLDMSFEKELELVHGVERVIQIPNNLGSTALGFEPIYAEDEAGDAVEFPRIKLNRQPLGGDGKVRRGHVGLTAAYDKYADGTGYAGETSEGLLPSASAIGAWVSNAPQNIISTEVTPGKWLVSGILTWVGAVTGTRADGSVSATSGTLGTGGDGNAQTPTMPTAAAQHAIVIPPKSFTITATQPMYLVGRIQFSAGVPTAYGRILADRATPVHAGYSGRVLGILWGG